jgi:hypothetical protein
VRERNRALSAEPGLPRRSTHDGHTTYDIPAVEGLADAVPHIMASRVAEWALGDQIDIIAHAADVQFQPPPARSVEAPAAPG